MPRQWRVSITGRRISCKKRESRKAFELRRQLNPHVGRRCAPDDRRRFRRPLNGRAASVQHAVKLQNVPASSRPLFRAGFVSLELRVRRIELFIFLSAFQLNIYVKYFLQKLHIPYLLQKLWLLDYSYLA